MQIAIDLDAQEQALLIKYMEECARENIPTSVGDFVLWREERGYNDDLTDTIV